MQYLAFATASVVGYPLVKALKVENVNKRKLVHTMGMLGACSLRDSFSPGESIVREFAVHAHFIILYSLYCIYDGLSVYEKLKKISPWGFILAHMLAGGTVLNFWIIFLHQFTSFSYLLYCQLWVGYAFGDAFSGLVGYNFGRLKIFGDRTLEGSIAFIVFALLFSSIFSSFLPPLQILPFIVLMALAEQLSPPNLDDIIIIGLMSVLGIIYGVGTARN